jgi:uncharacterized protein YjbJ (UPF0337 family)
MSNQMDTFEKRWRQTRDQVKERWDQITDEDLNRVRGRYEQMASLLQEKYDYSRKKAEEELDRLIERGEEMQARAESAVSEVDEAVVEYRWGVILAALGLGFVLGFLLGSKAAQ